MVWIEPTIYIDRRYSVDGKMPDMVITNNNKIEAIIELKCKPWEGVQYHGDLKKLMEYEKLAIKEAEIPLSWPPVSSNWSIQRETERKYQLKPDCLLV